MSAVPDVVNVAATLCQCQRRRKNVVRVTLRATMRNDKLNLNATWDIFREDPTDSSVSAETAIQVHPWPK